MLNSNDVFVLSYDITTYVWYGKGCSSLEMKVGDYIATTIVNKSAPMLGRFCISEVLLRLLLGKEIGQEMDYLPNFEFLHLINRGPT